MCKIKVVAGNLRGLKLDSSKNDSLRPTKDRVKESLFDIINFDIFNKTFLDLFGGTGQIGIEAFSRGAARVIIVEFQKNNVNLIRKNVSKIKNGHHIQIINMDALDFLRNNTTPIDIAFLDPPYSNVNLLQKSLEMSTEFINSNGILISETLSSQNIQNSVGNFSLKKRYMYGNISLNLYKSNTIL